MYYFRTTNNLKIIFMLAKIRKLGSKIEVAILMSSIILYSSCTKVKTAPQSDEKAELIENISENSNNFASRNASYSDEDVFKGIIFLSGPVSDKYLTGFNSMDISKITQDKELISDVNKSRDEIIAKLVSTNPMYLSDFRVEIGSGDYSRVETQIKKTTQDVLNALIAISNDNSNKQFVNGKINSFINSNHLTSSSSINDFKNALNKELGKDAKVDFKLKTKVMGYAYYVIFGVVFLVLVLFAAAESQNINQNHSNFYHQEFVTTITADLDAI